MDGSEESAAVLDYSRHLFKRASAELTFLRVIECSERRAYDQAYLSDSRHWKDRRLLLAARDTLAGISGSAEAEFRFGDPATEILREIVDGASDVAILNWHGRSWLGRPVRESVANRVLLSSPIPILYFPASASQEDSASSHPLRLRQILVLLDASPEAEEILPGVERMARTLDAGLHLFQAVSPGADEPARRREMDRYLSEVARGLESRRIPCHLRTRTGAALQSVLHVLSEGELDAVAVATHGRSGLAQALFGSLTKELLRGSHVPVLTVCMRDHRRATPVSGQRQPLRVI